MTAFKYSNLIKKEFLNLIENIVDNGGLYLGIRAIDYQEDRLRTFRKIVLAINEDVENIDELIAFLSEEIKTYNSEAFICYAKNLLEIAKNENAEEIFLEQDNMRYAFLNILPSESNYNIYEGLKRLHLLSLTRKIIKNHDLLKVLKMSLDTYSEEMKRCKLGSRRNLFKKYVDCGKEIYYILSNTIDKFDETTSDNDIIASLSSASIEFHCQTEIKPQGILNLIIKCNVYGMLRNNRKNIENRIKYTKQLLELLKESYDEYNDKLLDIINNIRDVIKDRVNLTKIFGDNNYLFGKMEGIDEPFYSDSTFLDFLQDNVYNNPNYENYLLEYIADQNIMRIILSYNDEIIKEIDREIFSSSLKDRPNRVEEAFDKIIKDLAEDNNNFNKVTDILWFRDISLLATECMKHHDCEECKTLLDIGEQIMENVYYLVSSKLAANGKETGEKLRRMDFIISNIKNNVVPESQLNNIYMSVKNKLSRIVIKEERNNNIIKISLNREFIEYIEDLKDIIEQNLHSEEKYQEYIRFEILRSKISEGIIINEFDNSQNIIRGIITTILNWKDDKINAIEYEIKDYQNALEREIHCQNTYGISSYRSCIIYIKRLQRLMLLVSDCAKNNPNLIIDEDFIVTCIKVEVAIQYMYKNVLSVSREIIDKKIDYEDFLEKTFKDEKYNKYLSIDDFINIVEEYNKDWLEYYKETDDEYNFEWRKRIIECNADYTKSMIKESLNNPEKPYEFFEYETSRNLIFEMGILLKRDEETVKETLSLFIKESKEYFELFRKVFDIEIDNYNKAIAIGDKTKMTHTYRDCLDGIINFKNIIIPLFEITKDLELSDDEAKELIDNFVEIEKAINYLSYNNLSPEDNILLKKIEYIDYIQSIINKPLARDIVKIILDDLTHKVDSLIEKYERENDSYELIFESSERKYIDILKSIIANNNYEQHRNSELIKNIIYSTAIINNCSIESIKSLVIKLRNYSTDLLSNVFDNLIFIRKCLCNIDSDKIRYDDIVKYENQIVSLEKARDMVLAIIENLKLTNDVDDIIYSYSKLKETVGYITDYRLANSEEAISKKIEYASNIENILTKNNYDIILSQIVKKLKNEYNKRLDEYIKNQDQFDIQLFKDKHIFEYFDELELNLRDPLKLKKYLNDYRTKEHVRGLIWDILVANNLDKNKKELVKIAIDKMKTVVDAFDYDIYVYEVARNRVINIEGKLDKETEYDNYINGRYILKDKILVLADIIKGYKNEDEFDKLFEDNNKLYSEIKIKIKTLTNNIISTYNERQSLHIFFYNICNMFYSYEFKAMIFCVIKDIMTDYQKEAKNTKYQNTAKLAELSLKKLDELKQKIKDSEDKNKFIEYIEEYKIMGYMETVTNHYYDNNKIELINRYIADKQLCEKVFDYMLREAEEYDAIYKQNNSNDVIDFRNLIEKLADEVKDISNIEERTTILYKKYFLKDYVGWNMFIKLYYDNLLRFDNKSVEQRNECINKYLFLIRKYQCEPQIDDILAITRSKFEKEINDKIISRHKCDYILYQDNVTMDIFDELCNNIKDKFIADKKYLNDYLEDEVKLSYFYDNWFNNGDYIEDKKYFILEAIKDKNRIENLFRRYIRGYSHISKEYYLDSKDSYKYKVAIRKAEKLEKEIFKIVEKVKDIEDKLEQESMINTLLITDEELKESFNNIFKFNELWKGDIDYISWNIGRFINLGFYYRNGKKKLMDKLFRDKYDEIEIDLDRSTNTYKTVNLIFDKIQLGNLIEALDNDYNSYFQIDKKITLLIRSLIKGICMYDNPDVAISDRDTISYHRGSLTKELIYIIKQHGINEFERVIDNMLDSIDIMYRFYKDIKPIDYEINLINNKDYPLYRKEIEVISNNIIKIYQLLKLLSKDDYSFRDKLNDTILSLELLNQLEYYYISYNAVPISTIHSKTILDKLKDIIDRNSKDIFNLAIDIIISENQIYYETLDDQRAPYSNSMEFFKNIRKEVIEE